MRAGAQFTETIAASATRRWFTFKLARDLACSLVCCRSRSSVPNTNITYWIMIRNLTSSPVNIEARYAVLN